jgi:hypothetical protein
MEQRRHFTLMRIESDLEGTKPYPTRVICSIHDGGTLVVWGEPDEMANVEALRAASFPCAILCLASTPPDIAHVPEAIAWVHPGDYLMIV